ncbi:hypothetical protein BK403_27945 [Escherichia coli]|uniref:ABC transporter substrate-binding protein n=3 Tax=Enterobacteriaceae TaxID=543 RepID=UPI00092ABD49|nr:ABC transporter substrate-binding protein [Escherichia coli]OJS17892.1 hypothetical protein BK396_26660 [Escherichia coli]OJS19068.1 hypothetical protein BK397_24120 [Escherichia coli]OJS43218.1 hypothetical protein BK403_27945 [Escherichia coli]
MKQIRTKLMQVMSLVLLLVMAITPTAAQDDTLEDLRFFLSYIPNIQFSPLYVAAAQGYFAEAGFNIVFEHGDENIGLEQIAVGDLNFGTISGEQVVLARANDRPIVSVYEWYQQVPIGVLIPSTSDATTISELEGRKVGVPGRFGASYIGLIALLQANGMEETDIQLETIGFVAPDVICAGGVEAAVVYLNNEPLQVQHRADAGECGDVTGITVIPLTESVDLVSNGIATNETMIAEQPETVAAVIAAFDQGVRDTINNPALTYLLSIDYIEGLPASEEFVAALEAAAEAQTEFLATEPSREEVAASRAELWAALAEEFTTEDLLQFEVLLTTIELWDADVLGEATLESWEVTEDVLQVMGMTGEEGIDLEAAYTNDFLPEE